MTQKKRKMMGAVLAALVLMAMFAVTVFAGAEDAPKPPMYATSWSLVPPAIAIRLALATPGVPSALVIGILV